MMEGYAVSRRCNTLETATVDLNFSVGFELYCGQRPSSSLTAECGERFGLQRGGGKRNQLDGGRMSWTTRWIHEVVVSRASSTANIGEQRVLTNTAKYWNK
jgi:hypothetical protein